MLYIYFSVYVSVCLSVLFWSGLVWSCLSVSLLLSLHDTPRLVQQVTLNDLMWINGQVVAEVIEAQLGIGQVDHVALVGFLPVGHLSKCQCCSCFLIVLPKFHQVTPYSIHHSSRQTHLCYFQL